ncbi:MAG: methyltransferase domain-containing protein [Thermoleophilia bacterium]
MENKPIAAGKSAFEIVDTDVVFGELELKPDTILLDVASGVGNYALPAAEIIGENGAVYAVDLWQEGIEELGRRASELGLKNITAINADASKEIPLEDESVDTCLIATALHDLAEVNAAEGALREIARVLKPGGRLVIVEFKKMEGPPGPPLKIRFSPDELDELVLPFGFEKKHTVEAGEYFYLSSYVRRQAAIKR